MSEDSLSKSKPMYQTLISVPDLEKYLGDPSWIILDCRFNLSDTDQGWRDFEKSHIPGSQYAHLDKDLSGPIIPGVSGRHPLPNIDRWLDRIKKWGIANHSQVVAYDYGSGGIAARLWWMLRWIGHDAVAVLDGGWSAWEDSGAPQTDELKDFSDVNFKADMRSKLLVDRTVVDAVRQNEGWVLIDSRAEERYLGKVEPIDPVAGHIPGALNRPFQTNLRDGTWKSPQELNDQFKVQCGKVAADHTIFYCGSGVTACHNILAFKHAGLGDALLYPGSWSEWINFKPNQNP